MYNIDANENGMTRRTIEGLGTQYTESGKEGMSDRFHQWIVIQKGDNKKE
jgi:hypothetical protein